MLEPVQKVHEASQQPPQPQPGLKLVGFGIRFSPCTLLASLEKSGVRGEEEEEAQPSLTSCSESPSMISDTSCSLRAADMESPPLPLCPTLLGKGSETLRCSIL